MRSTIFALSMLAGLTALASPAIAAGYCAGYQAGYKAAFCAGKQLCDASPSGCPSDPYAPDTYQAGYDRGYRDGSAARRR
jgi:hypothetical protein